MVPEMVVPIVYALMAAIFYGLYRWLAGIAGDKIGGAWFDHGDCAEHDFLDQAYTSVLAGASELVFFNFSNVMAGHPDHEKVIAEFDMLAEMAAFVREHPVVGVPAYKPPNSHPEKEPRVFDFVGMMGLPLVPCHEFPDDAQAAFFSIHALDSGNVESECGKSEAHM